MIVVFILKHISLRICSKYFSVTFCVLNFCVCVYCLSTIINGDLRTYSCEDCYIRGHSEGKDRAGDIDFQEIMAQVLLHWFGTPVNTTAIFQIKLVISSIETAGNSVTPSVTHTHALYMLTIHSHDVKY